MSIWWPASFPKMTCCFLSVYVFLMNKNQCIVWKQKCVQRLYEPAQDMNRTNYCLNQPRIINTWCPSEGSLSIHRKCRNDMRIWTTYHISEITISEIALEDNLWYVWSIRVGITRFVLFGDEGPGNRKCHQIEWLRFFNAISESCVVGNASVPIVGVSGQLRWTW